MKNIFFFSLLSILIFSGCNQKVEKNQKSSSLENTIKSISYFSDSAKIEPSVIFQAFENVNKLIDTLGYPDAGYKLWIIQNDTTENIRFMIEGAWPNQTIYDTIHNNEKYTNAMKNVSKVASNLKTVSYYRFALVK